MTRSSRGPSARGMPYVNKRWLGGLLTNFQTMSDRIDRLHELVGLKEDGRLDLLPTKERMSMEAELEKLEFNLGGVRDMKRLPQAVLIVDLKTEAIAVAEADPAQHPDHRPRRLERRPDPGHVSRSRATTTRCARASSWSARSARRPRTRRTPTARRRPSAAPRRRSKPPPRGRGEAQARGGGAGPQGGRGGRRGGGRPGPGRPRRQPGRPSSPPQQRAAARSRPASAAAAPQPPAAAAHRARRAS